MWPGIAQIIQNNKFAIYLQYLKKEVSDEVDFLHAEQHQSFPQVDFSTLGIKNSHKVILSLLMGMIKHSQSTQSSKSVIPLQYLKKEVWDGWSSFFFQISKFLQVGIIVFDGSGQTCPKYPK